MLNWIEVNIVDMPLEITFVADSVLPESPLPQSHLTVWAACNRTSSLDNCAGKLAFDERPADGKVRISVGQRHDHVQVIGQYNDRIDHKWMLPSRLDYRRSQQGNVLGQDVRRSVEQCRRDEERPAVKKISAVLNHAATLPRISLRSIRATSQPPRYSP